MRHHSTATEPQIKLVPRELILCEFPPDLRVADLMALQDDIQENGLLTPLTVAWLGDRGCRVTHGCRRLICLGSLLYMDVPCYDRLTGTHRPASETYRLVPCVIGGDR